MSARIAWNVNIIPATVMTVEYRAHDGKCGICGNEDKASFPNGIEGTVSYGDNMIPLQKVLK